MDVEEWEPYYREILRDFGYTREDDEATAARLDALLAGRRVTDLELDKMLRGRWVTVAGNAPSLESELDRLKGVVIAADEATSVLTARGQTPQILVTDLDGTVEDQLAANADGCVAVIHAHGDNLPAVEAWAPRFTGPVVGTTQARPIGGLRNFGGFTDGDRAVLLAAHFGASKITLVGFDFENPSPKDDRELKKRKLDWAYMLVTTVMDLE